MTSGPHATSNQRWNNVVCVNFEIYNVQQRWNKAVYFKVELNNVKQRRNNVVIFNIDFHNIGQRCEYAMTIWKQNFFNRAFLKNNIETKSGCKFDKVIRENLWEFQ